MTLKERLVEAVAAAFSGVWIRSYEHEDALQAIGEVCRDHAWKVALWDPARGLRKPDSETEEQMMHVDALGWLMQQPPNKNEERTLLVMRNLHPMLMDASGRVTNPTLLQQLQLAIEQGSRDGKHVLILAYEGIKLPVELEKMLLVLDHDLPNAAELRKLMEEVGDANDAAKLPKADSPEGQLLTSAAAGLTRLEAVGSFALSLARHSAIKADTLFELKSEMLNKSGLLELYQGTEGFETLGGLNAVKDFCLRAFNSPNRSKKIQPRGIILVGPPGTGKSALSKALGNEVGLPTVLLDIGRLMGSLIGQTEEQTRKALRLADALSPCVLHVD